MSFIQTREKYRRFSAEIARHGGIWQVSSIRKGWWFWNTTGREFAPDFPTEYVRIADALEWGKPTFAEKMRANWRTGKEKFKRDLIKYINHL